MAVPFNIYWQPGPANALSVVSLRRLQRLNAAAGTVHLVFAAIMFAVADGNATMPLYSLYANGAPAHDATALRPVARRIADSALSFEPPIFLLATAALHLLLCSLLRDIYGS